MAMLMLTINASTYKESKIMHHRKVNAPYGSLFDISSFSHSDASKEIIVFRFVRPIMNAPLWDFACSIGIFTWYMIYHKDQIKIVWVLRLDENSNLRTKESMR